MNIEALETVARDVTPYLRLLGYVPPSRAIVDDLRDRAREHMGDLTPTGLYCWAVVNRSDNRELHTLALILGA